ncbi:MAG: PilZ domain-containing protein [Candidatus Omnitrophica bacterium]|nr:PilZ domain-containing protein [Candidatus Omnitrophota bacterium]
MNQERRQTPRVVERVSVALADAQTAFQAETQNLSASGVYCTLDRFIPPMTKLHVEFDLPNGARVTRIRCSGVVVRVEPLVANVAKGRYYLAIFFTDLSERDRSAISQFVQRHLTSTRTTP